MLAQRCPSGYVEYPSGSGVCEPYNPSQQQARRSLDSVNGPSLPSAPAMPSTPSMPAVGGLRR